MDRTACVGRGFPCDMAEKERPEVRVERATDAARYLASDKLIWFDGTNSTVIGVTELMR